MREDADRLIARPVRTALAFLTRLPVPLPRDPDLSRAAWSFPLVGLLVGGAAAATRAGADQLLPPLPATILAIAVAILITGALHEDGLADVADAVGAHVDRARRLEILKDPRVGTFGATALILELALVATSVAALAHRGGGEDADRRPRALALGDPARRIAAAREARWCGQPAARDDGRASRSRRSWRAAAAIVAGAAIALAAAALTAAAAALLLHRTLGGITGDGYGATAKLTEVVVCVTLVAFWG